MNDVKLDFLFKIVVETAGAGGIHPIKHSPWGDYIIVDVSGGMVEGPWLSAKVLPSGGDWGLTISQGSESQPVAVTNLDARLVLQTTDDAAIIYMTYTGISYDYPDAGTKKYTPREEKDPSAYYFRTTPYFRTAAPAYDWLNRIVTVATGVHRERAGPVYYVYQVL